MRLKERLESIAYRGLDSRRPAPVRQNLTPAWLERLIDSPAPSDPLYLSNRRWFSRLLPWVLIGGASLALITGMTMVASSTKNARHQAVNPGELKILPRPTSGPRLEVAELAVQTGKEPAVIGTVKNVSPVAISKGRISIRLEDKFGGFAGNVEAEVPGIEPGATTFVRFPLQDSRIRRAMVIQVFAE